MPDRSCREIALREELGKVISVQFGEVIGIAIILSVRILHIDEHLVRMMPLAGISISQSRRPAGSKGPVKTRRGREGPRLVEAVGDIHLAIVICRPGKLGPQIFCPVKLEWLVLQIAVFIGSVGIPFEIGTERIIECQRCHEAIDPCPVVRRALFSSQINAITKAAVLRQRPTRIGLRIKDTVGTVADFRGQHRLGRRALGAVGDNAAWRADAVHEAGQPLERGHAFDRFQRKVPAPVQQQGNIIDIVVTNA